MLNKKEPERITGILISPFCRYWLVDKTFITFDIITIIHIILSLLKYKHYNDVIEEPKVIRSSFDSTRPSY